MKYDDASWHYDGDFPSELPTDAGATHIGMFVVWCFQHQMAGRLHTDEFPEELETLRERVTTPGQFVINSCDEKFTDEDLTDEGNAFAQAYFGPPEARGQYLSDYEEALSGDEPTLYHIHDSWENYEKLSPVVERRFSEWKEGKLQTLEREHFQVAESVNKKPWWKFW
jgi:hypothetical protein